MEFPIATLVYQMVDSIPIKMPVAFEPALTWKKGRRLTNTTESSSYSCWHCFAMFCANWQSFLRVTFRVYSFTCCVCCWYIRSCSCNPSFDQKKAGHVGKNSVALPFLDQAGWVVNQNLVASNNSSMTFLHWIMKKGKQTRKIQATNILQGILWVLRELPSSFQ